MSEYINTIRTTEGKYVSQVRTYANGVETTRYETPEYVTKQMATADAKCWKAFNMEKVNNESEFVIGEYTINADDKVYTSLGNLLTGEHLIASLVMWVNKGYQMEFKCYPFSQSTNEGFHFHIANGRTTSRFTIIKGE